MHKRCRTLNIPGARLCAERTHTPFVFVHYVEALNYTISVLLSGWWLLSKDSLCARCAAFLHTTNPTTHAPNTNTREIAQSRRRRVLPRVPCSRARVWFVEPADISRYRPVHPPNEREATSQMGKIIIKTACRLCFGCIRD